MSNKLTAVIFLGIGVLLGSSINIHGCKSNKPKIIEVIYFKSDYEIIVDEVPYQVTERPLLV